MARVTCKACGKGYNYQVEGCCPKCGAYNRPPYRNRVGSDGLVHHIGDEDFLHDSAKRSRTVGGKVCFERDECHEEQSRWTSRMEQRQRNSGRTAGSTAKGASGSKNSPIARIFLIGILVFILPLISTMCRYVTRYEDIFGHEEPVRPDSQAWLELINVGTYEAELEEYFPWCGEVVRLREYSLETGDGVAQVLLTMSSHDTGALPMIEYEDTDGFTVTRSPDNWWSDNFFSFYEFRDLLDCDEDTLFYAFFPGSTDGNYFEVRVPLDQFPAQSVDTTYLLAGIGERFSWWDSDTQVDSISVSIDGHDAEASVLVCLPPTVDDMPWLTYQDIYGWEQMSSPHSVQVVSELPDGAKLYRFSFLMPDCAPDSSSIVAHFAGQSDGRWQEVCVSP